MNELLLGLIASIVGVLFTEIIGRFFKKKIASRKVSSKESPTISIGNNQFEIKGLSQEKKREFNLLSSTIVIQNPETGFPAGTGFVINEKNAITTFHVVDIASRNQEKLVDVKFAITGDIYQAKVVENLIDQDIAIIEFDSPLPTGVLPLEIQPNDINAGNKFRTFGYGGRDSFGLWANGEIMGLMKDNQNQERIQLSSSEILPGMSGAPIIDEQSNKVIGILTAIYADKDKPRLNTIAFATPIDTSIVNKVKSIGKST